MNYWKVSFLYPQIVHDYTTALTIAHTLANESEFTNIMVSVPNN